MDPQLGEFIQKAKSASMSDDDIRSSLQSVGWNPDDIERALTIGTVTGGTPSNTSAVTTTAQDTSPLRSRKIRVIALLCILSTVLVVGCGIAYKLTVSAKESLRAKEGPTVVPTVAPNTSSPSFPPVTISQGQPIDVNAVRNILVYVETPKEGETQVVEFYDVNTQKKLPRDSLIEADKNIIVMLGPWSPDGQYLPILGFTGSASTTHEINMYLFDARTLKSAKIFHGSSDDDSITWDDTSFSFSSAWIDKTKFVLQTTRDQQGILTSVTYMNISGEISNSSEYRELKKASKQLEYSLNQSPRERGNAIRSIQVGTVTMPSIPEGEVVGVVDGMLAMVVKPQSPYIDIMTNQDMSPELQQQMEDLQKQGLTEEELSQRMLELMRPQGKTMLNLYDPGDGTLKKSISLKDGAWQTQSILVQPSGKTLIAHQTDNVVQASKQRFVLINPVDDSSMQVLFEEDLQRSVEQPYASLMLFQGVSFFVSQDGSYLIGMRNSPPSTSGSNLPSWDNQTIFMRDIANGEETVVCSANCFDMRVYYPNHLMTRF